ncbi:MAG: carbohydrate binding family 9 domain-containing protein, partial [Gammaproteobacteria bacterium]|nr:carbohydrate binding family 9 domain-containing protein [Gammaproteobacteria bacterium]
MSKIGRAVYLALGVAVVASPVLAQDQQLQNPPDGGPAIVVLEAEPLLPDMGISLDGVLDEAMWSRALPITDFTQQEPVEGGVPSQRTEVRVLFDEDNIYISAILYDDPEGILAYQMQRDAPLMTDDRFMWILDTFNDGRTGYFFEINPNGLMGDGLITGSGGGGGRGGGG